MPKAPIDVKPDWWRGAVIYQIYPRSFQDSTDSGSGDLAGITRRLDHVASLGVDAIWISPFFTSPLADMGYDVSDFCAVDPSFGTMADFDALLAKAHALGLRVIIDQAFSLSSDQHPWFSESRRSRDNAKSDWYVWADPKPDGSPPNNWLSAFGGPAWEWDGLRRQYYLHNLLIQQPDLNFHNPAVQEAVLEIVRFWLDRGVDGFRLSVCNYYFHDRKLRSNPPHPVDNNRKLPANPYGMQLHLHDKSQPESLGYLKRLRLLLDQYSSRISIGEIIAEERTLEVVSDYTGGGDKLHMSYTFDLLSSDGTPTQIASAIERFEAAVPEGWVCWSLSNHDVPRHLTRWLRPGEDPTRVAKLAATLLMSLRGSICFYQGEELGLEQSEIPFEKMQDPRGIRFWSADEGRDGCRTPMPWEAEAEHAGFSTVEPWLPLDARHAERAVDQQGAPGTVLDHYRRMLAFRKAHPALVTGDIQVLEGSGDLLAFDRIDGTSRLRMVFNTGRDTFVYRLPETARLLALPGFPDVSAETGHLKMPPRSAACCQID
ncbi:alpha-amylase family glycosyl hydrolase [Tropicimonas sp. IMCC6043]|uniref:alpha-amylase family glycosyl hydrolase n=1 Tax=Tropicimonas sp. IMCC6043 TaxID=2510645 RepID=UPI00101D9999|nr:alpha-amylase family glycosyl hydrolase [Tropicimonas sp. IMCC6043]RYH11604.1 DUF3459 domain-containing protein [Tropicimonas sp. IMCC6043]